MSSELSSFLEEPQIEEFRKYYAIETKGAENKGEGVGS